MLNNLFKKETPKEAAMKAKRETKKEVRVRLDNYMIDCLLFDMDAARFSQQLECCTTIVILFSAFFIPFHFATVQSKRYGS
jgi:hypothetical protein